ncbi:MAG: thioredoxin family protein [Sphingobacteriaceae bacterium]|nr:thioredoxin family protein [Sphingobacteriaceae bacterium]
MKSLKIILSLLLLTCLVYAFTSERVSAKQDDGMTVEEYVKKTENKDKIVFVYFKADWCAPCIKLKPAIEQLQTEEKEKVEILVIDVDENKKVSTHFEINTLPLFIIYKNGKKVWENNTSLPKAEIQKKLNLYK